MERVPLTRLVEWAAFYQIQAPSAKEQPKKQSWRDIKAMFTAESRKRRRHGDSRGAERPPRA